MFPNKNFIPEVTDSSGANYYDRPEQMLYFVIGGGDQDSVLFVIVQSDTGSGGPIKIKSFQK